MRNSEWLYQAVSLDDVESDIDVIGNQYEKLMGNSTSLRCQKNAILLILLAFVWICGITFFIVGLYLVVRQSHSMGNSRISAVIVLMCIGVIAISVAIWGCNDLVKTVRGRFAKKKK